MTLKELLEQKWNEPGVENPLKIARWRRVGNRLFADTTPVVADKDDKE